MANNENLIPSTMGGHQLTEEDAKKGGVKSGEVRRRKRSMLNDLEKLLNEENPKTNKTYQELATLGLIKGAVNGSSKNYELIYNLMSEKEKKEKGNEINISIPAKDIAKSFIDVNRSIDNREYREYYFEGGRGSTKSSFISEKIIEILENNPRMCCVVLRKVKDTLKDSVYSQLEWAIDTLSETYVGLKDRWKLTKSPLEITNTVTGQKIYFRGADDYGKIKSLKPPKGMYIGITWYEEYDQFAGMEEVRKINQSLIRGGEDFVQFYSYNTPASSMHFVNVEKIIVQSNTDVIKLRKFVISLGFKINRERLVKDSDIIYTVIEFIRGEEKYSYEAIYFGPRILENKDELFTEYYTKKLLKYENLLLQLPSHEIRSILHHKKLIRIIKKELDIE